MLKQILKFKEAILYITLIVGTFIYLMMQIIPQVMDLIRTEQKIKKRTVELEKETKKLEKKKEEIQSKKEEEAERVKILYKPDFSFDMTGTEYTLMIDDIMNMIKDNGAKIYSVDYNFTVEKDEIVLQSAGKYLGCQLKIAIISNYSQLQNLIMDLIKYPYLLKLNSIESEPYENNQKYLLSIITLTLYSEQ